MKIEKIVVNGVVGKTIVYVSVQNESVFDNLVRRKTRPVNEWRDVLTKPVLEALDLTDKQAYLRWNQNAGCKCGCSPGFFVIHRMSLRQDRGREVCVYISGTDDEMMDQSHEAVVVRDARAESIAEDPILVLLLKKPTHTPQKKKV